VVRGDGCNYSINTLAELWSLGKVRIYWLLRLRHGDGDGDNKGDSDR